MFQVHRSGFGKVQKSTNKYSINRCLQTTRSFPLIFFVGRSRVSVILDRKNIPYSYSRDRRDFPARVIRPASTFTTPLIYLSSSKLLLLFLHSFVFAATSPHKPRNKNPEEQRRAEEAKRNEKQHREKIIGDVRYSREIPEMLVEITIDRCVIRKKQRDPSVLPLKEIFA